MAITVLDRQELRESTEGTRMTGESRLLGFDFGDWLMLVVGLALAGSLTFII